ncbi:hypothetical protein LCGC14_1476850 [marine sediment metagenome]|uniref:Uncharacterized protein n=1 Tax=marine sediment metagenome TaxID=412755 RepID=A0A0F9JWR0_9ZZZZ
MSEKPKTLEEFMSNEWLHMLLELKLIKDKVANNTKLTYLILGAVIAAAFSRAVF